MNTRPTQPSATTARTHMRRMHTPTSRGPHLSRLHAPVPDPESWEPSQEWLDKPSHGTLKPPRAKRLHAPPTHSRPPARCATRLARASQTPSIAHSHACSSCQASHSLARSQKPPVMVRRARGPSAACLAATARRPPPTRPPPPSAHPAASLPSDARRQRAPYPPLLHSSERTHTHDPLTATAQSTTQARTPTHASPVHTRPARASPAHARATRCPVRLAASALLAAGPVAHQEHLSVSLKGSSLGLSLRCPELCSLCSRLFRTLVIARSRLSRPHVSNRCTHPFTPVRHHVRHTWHERTRHPARVTQTEWCPHGAYTIPFRVPVRPRRPPPPRPRPFASNVSFASHAFTHTTTHILCGSLPVSVPSHR